MKRCTVKH